MITIDEALDSLPGPRERYRPLLDAENIMRRICRTAEGLATRRGTSPWVIIGDVTGHGIGVSDAIYRLYKDDKDSENDEDHNKEDSCSASDSDSPASAVYPSPGSSTGLCDSDGREICVGDTVKTEVTGNVEYHGSWATYKVFTRGMVPVLMYVASEKGAVFPPGYTGCPLSDKYEAKMLLWGSDLSNVRPLEEMFVIDPGNEGQASTDHE